MKLRIEHVRGHGTCIGNIGADALAAKAIEDFVEKRNKARWLKGYRGKPLVYVRSSFGGQRNEEPLLADKAKLEASYEKVNKNLAERRAAKEKKIQETYEKVQKLIQERKKSNTVEEDKPQKAEYENLKITVDNSQIETRNRQARQTPQNL